MLCRATARASIVARGCSAWHPAAVQNGRFTASSTKVPSAKIDFDDAGVAYEVRGCCFAESTCGCPILIWPALATAVGVEQVAEEIMICLLYLAIFALGECQASAPAGCRHETCDPGIAWPFTRVLFAFEC